MNEQEKFSLMQYDPYRAEVEKLQKLNEKKAQTDAAISRLHEDLNRVQKDNPRTVSVDDILESDCPGATFGQTGQRESLLDSLSEQRRSLRLIEQAIAEQKIVVGSLLMAATQFVVKKNQAAFEDALSRVRKHVKPLLEAFRDRKRLIDEIESAGGYWSTIPEKYRQTDLECSLGNPDEVNSKGHIFLNQIGAK